MSAPPQAGFIGELCVALAHRWEPERLFVILTAYMDESGTHAGSPATVMGGFMATAAQWAKFQTELNGLRRKHGFQVVHTTDLKHGKGEFSGWSNERRAHLLKDVSQIIEEDRLMEGFTFTINNSEFREDYRAGDKPRKLRLDTEYGLCVRNCLLYLLTEVERRLSHHRKFSETKMHIVLESGHKHAGDAIRVFNEVKEHSKEFGVDFLQSITFAKKDECDPLMAADILSHIVWWAGQQAFNNQEPTDYEIGLKQRSSGGVTSLTYKRNGLSSLKDRLVTQRPFRKKT